MINRLKKCAIVAGATLLLLACEEKNPLLGEWTLDQTSNVAAYDLKMAEVTGNGRITFEKDRMISGTHARAVSYTVSGNTVTVRYSKSGDKNTYDIVDNSTFSFDIPEVGTFKYVKIR